MLKLPRLKEKEIQGVPHGYSLAASWSTRLTDAILQAPERLFLWPWYSRIPIDRPIFVIGPFRSGTTILEKIISEHPDVGYFGYQSNVFYRAPVAGQLFLDFLCRTGILDSAVSQPIIHNPRILQTRQSPYECEWIWSQGRKGLWNEGCTDLTAGADYSDPRFERYLRSVIRRHLWLQKTPRFMNKNPVNCLRLGYLRKIFPGARFVTIVRDPVETIVSHYRTAQKIQKAFYATPETRRLIRDKLHMDLLSDRIKTANYARNVALTAEHPLLGIAGQWSDLQSAVLDSLAREVGLIYQTLQLRYEELVSEPARVLQSLWRFLELADGREEFINRTYIENLSPPPPLQLTPEEQALMPRVWELVAPVAQRIGYEAGQRVRARG